MKNFHIILFFLLLSMKVRAGDFCIAPQLAYGKEASSPFLFTWPSEFEIFRLFKTTRDFYFLRSGAMISYERKWFSYSTGLLYSRVFLDNHYFAKKYRGINIFQLPLDCNLQYGKRLYGYLSAGIYVNYLYKQHESVFLKFPMFQVGFTAGIGIGYHFNSILAIDMVYRAEKSKQPLYYSVESSSAGPWGRAYYLGAKVPFRTLSLSLKYTIGRKNNEYLNKRSSQSSVPRSILKRKHNRSGKRECIRSN